MSTSADIHRRRQDLGVALRELRESTRLSGARLAIRLGVSQSKISKIETGLVRPSADEIEAILHALGASESASARIRELGQIATLTFTPFSRIRQSGIHNKQRIVGAWEHESTEIRNFVPTLIPGLLQTREYVSALFTLPHAKHSHATDAAISARLARQSIVYEPGKRLRFLIPEAGMRARISSGLVMASQLEYIATISKLPTVEVAILPWHARLPTVFLNQFTAFDERWVLIENLHGELKTRERQDVVFYMQLFESLQEVALQGDAAREFLREVADEHRGLPD